MARSDDPVDPERLAGTDAPLDRPSERLDVRELPPPKPLQETLERLSAMDDETVLLQYSDRAPQFLFPKLAERGYDFATVEGTDAVLTAIWAE